MGPEYDVIMMLGDLVLIFLFFWLLINLGFAVLDQLYGAEARLMQEHISGFLSMSNFAPEHFYSSRTFPKASHVMTILKEPQLVSIKSGSSAERSDKIGENLFDTAVDVVFTQRTPLGYVLSLAEISGSCASGCALSRNEYNVIEIKKEGYSVTANLISKQSRTEGE